MRSSRSRLERLGQTIFVMAGARCAPAITVLRVLFRRVGERPWQSTKLVMTGTSLGTAAAYAPYHRTRRSVRPTSGARHAPHRPPPAVAPASGLFRRRAVAGGAALGETGRGLQRR